MTDCKHYWVLESPNGPTAKGECKLCHEIREFPNVNDSNKDAGRKLGITWNRISNTRTPE